MLFLVGLLSTVIDDCTWIVVLDRAGVLPMLREQPPSMNRLLAPDELGDLLVHSPEQLDGWLLVFSCRQSVVQNLKIGPTLDASNACHLSSSSVVSVQHEDDVLLLRQEPESFFEEALGVASDANVHRAKAADPRATKILVQDGLRTPRTTEFIRLDRRVAVAVEELRVVPLVQTVLGSLVDLRWGRDVIARIAVLTIVILYDSRWRRSSRP